MTIFTQTLLVIFCCIGNCPFHSNLSSWSNLKNRNINRCKTSQHLKSQLQVLEINCGSSWWQEVLPLHLTTTHSLRYTQTVVSHALPRNTTSRVGFSPRLFVFVGEVLCPRLVCILSLSFSSPSPLYRTFQSSNAHWWIKCDIFNALCCYPQRTATMQQGTQRLANRKCENGDFQNARVKSQKLQNQIRKPLICPLYPCQVAQIPDPRSLGILTRRGRTYMRHRRTKAAWPPPTITNILAFVPHLFWNIFLPTPAVLVTV